MKYQINNNPITEQFNSADSELFSEFLKRIEETDSADGYTGAICVEGDTRFEGDKQQDVRYLRFRYVPAQGETAICPKTAEIDIPETSFLENTRKVIPPVELNQFKNDFVRFLKQFENRGCF